MKAKWNENTATEWIHKLKEEPERFFQNMIQKNIILITLYKINLRHTDNRIINSNIHYTRFMKRVTSTMKERKSSKNYRRKFPRAKKRCMPLGLTGAQQNQRKKIFIKINHSRVLKLQRKGKS